MKYIKTLWIQCFLLMVFNGNSQVLDPPQIQCVSVLPNGDVEITWSSITDPFGVFNSYAVYNGGGTLLTNIANIATNSYIHLGAGANASSQSFYMQSLGSNTSNNSSITSTVNTMFLLANNPGNGIAWLTWSPISVPKLAGASDYYYIYKEYPAGTWTLIDSTMVGNESYTDTITVCGDQINYRVTQSNGNCVSVSNVAGGFFSDQIAPAILPVNTASVDTANGNVNLTWGQNPSEDTEAYIVFYFDGSGWVVADTVWGIGNTNYTHQGGWGNIQSTSYGIASFDSCWTGGSPNTSALGQFHETIYLTSSPRVCDYGVSLSWNAYQNWPSGVASYELLVSENGAAPTSFGTTTNTQMDLSGLNGGSNYCFVIKATSNNGRTALSNKHCTLVQTPVQPTSGYLSTATVQGKAVLIKYEGDPNASLQAIKVERADQPGGPFKTLGTSAVTGPLTTFLDETAIVSQLSYYYRVVALDTCGNESIVSNLGKNIVCEIELDDYSHKTTLQWNNYEDWDGSIKEYRVYRSANGVFDPNPIQVLNPVASILEDDVSGLLDQDGEFCYYIQAVEEGNSSGNNEVSNSNVVCAYMESLVWVPNAIVIGGANPEFKPVMSYVEHSDYQLRIFDRWGHILFTSYDINTPWKGEDQRNGETVREGVYVYVLEYRNSLGEFKDKKGSVTVVR